MIRTRPALQLLAVLVPVSASAQYATTANDTLWYSEATHATVEMISPNGPIQMRSRHDAVIGITFPAPGRASAWYASLVLDQQDPRGTTTPNTAAMLGQQFQLDFEPNGRIVTRETPTMPADIASMTDLTRQFDDFFITIPSGDLVVGVTWADTVSNNKAARETDQTMMRHIRTYVVDRDTAVLGANALVIRVDQQIEIRASSEIPAQQMSVSTTLVGTETGWAIFVPSTGRLIERQRNGSLEGELQMRSPTMPPAVLPQTYTYESRIALRAS